MGAVGRDCEWGPICTQVQGLGHPNQKKRMLFKGTFLYSRHTY